MFADIITFFLIRVTKLISAENPCLLVVYPIMLANLVFGWIYSDCQEYKEFVQAG